MAVINDLRPRERDALQKLYGAAVDPGQLLWGELRDRLRTTDQVVATITNRLARKGLVEQVDWDGSKFREVHLTAAGGELCKTLGFQCFPRT